MAFWAKIPIGETVFFTVFHWRKRLFRGEKGLCQWKKRVSPREMPFKTLFNNLKCLFFSRKGLFFSLGKIHFFLFFIGEIEISTAKFLIFPYGRLNEKKSAQSQNCQ
jgi:hypothetical protein